MVIDYKHLDEIASDEEYWEDIEIVNNLNISKRLEFLRNFLDYFRLEFAIYSKNYLVSHRLAEFKRRFRELLKAPWTLDRDESLPFPSVIRLDTLHKSARLVSKSMGPTSSLGKYIKQMASEVGASRDVLKSDRYRDFILR